MGRSPETVQAELVEAMGVEAAILAELAAARSHVKALKAELDRAKLAEATPPDPEPDPSGSILWDGWDTNA